MTLRERIAKVDAIKAEKERIAKVLRAYKCQYCGNTHGITDNGKGYYRAR